MKSFQFFVLFSLLSIFSIRAQQRVAVPSKSGGKTQTTKTRANTNTNTKVQVKTRSSTGSKVPVTTKTSKPYSSTSISTSNSSQNSNSNSSDAINLVSSSENKGILNSRGKASYSYVNQGLDAAFILIKLSNGNYIINNLATGKVLGEQGNSIIFSPISKNSNVQYRIQNLAGGKIAFSNAASGKFLSVANGNLSLSSNSTSSASQWIIKNANTKEAVQNQASFIVSGDTNVHGSDGISAEMEESLSFEQIKSAVKVFQSHGSLTQNPLNSASDFGNILNSIKLDAYENEIYTDFKREFKVTFNENFEDMWLDFRQPNFPQYNNTYTTLTGLYAQIANDDVKISKLQQLYKLNNKLAKLESQRAVVLNIFKIYNQLLEDWQTQTSTDLENIYNNLTLEGQSSLVSSPDFFTIIKNIGSTGSTVSSAAGFSHVSTAVGLFNSIANIAVEMSKNSQFAIGNNNQAKITVANFRQEIIENFNFFRKALTSYQNLILSDASMMEKVIKVEQSMKVGSPKYKYIVGASATQMQKDFWKVLLPSKAIMVSFIRFADSGSRIPSSINPFEHLFTDYGHIKEGDNSARYNKDVRYTLLKVKDGSKFANIGEGGEAGLEEIRRLFTPQEIEKLIPSSEHYIFDYTDYNSESRLSEAYPRNTKFIIPENKTGNYEKEYSKINPKSLRKNPGQVAFEVVLQKVSVDSGSDPGDELELFGKISASIVNIPSNWQSGQEYSHVSGMDNEEIWKVNETEVEDPSSYVYGATVEDGSEHTINSTRRVILTDKKFASGNTNNIEFRINFDVKEEDDFLSGGDDTMTYNGTNSHSVKFSEIMQKGSIEKTCQLTNGSQKATFTFQFRRLVYFN